MIATDNDGIHAKNVFEPRREIRDINKDVDLNMASNSSVFSPRLKKYYQVVSIA